MQNHIKLLGAVESTDDFDLLGQIYLGAFPPEERRPWDEIVRPHKAEGPALTGIYDDHGRLAGFISYWHLDGFVYVEHFAIDPALRNCGLGSKALTAFIQSVSPLSVVLEVEHPQHSADMASRRLAFYRRHGFGVIDHGYIQPPYSPGLPAVPLLLMSTSAGLNPSTTASQIHRHVYGLRPSRLLFSERENNNRAVVDTEPRSGVNNNSPG